MITATNQFHLCHSAFARVATAGHQRTCGHGLFKVVNNGTRNEGISALAGMEHFASAHSRGLRLGLAVKLPCRYWLCLSAFVRVATAEKQCSALRICCEKVDSFSSVGESGLALTIFPFSFAAKATYVAINDSFGRAIDRFFGANRTGISVSYDFAEHPCL